MSLMALRKMPGGDSGPHMGKAAAQALGACDWRLLAVVLMLDRKSVV